MKTRNLLPHVYELKTYPSRRATHGQWQAHVHLVHGESIGVLGVCNRTHIKDKNCGRGQEKRTTHDDGHRYFGGRGILQNSTRDPRRASRYFDQAISTKHR